MAKRSKKKENSGTKFLLTLLVILIIIAAGLLAYKFAQDNPKILQVANENVMHNTTIIPEPKPVIKEVQIFKGDDRPIAVMIDNHDDARPQVSINDAYIVYEIIVEGGYTRMMPVFKGVNLDEIGPIRSARHYFLDYALENDAIFVHYGESPQAGSDISKLNVDAINGIYQSSSDFWRTSGKYSPHNVLTTTDKILKIAENKKYSTTSSKKSVLRYTVDEVDLDSGQDALEVYIPFSNSQNVKFEYNDEKKIYVKYANNKKQTDWRSKEDIAFKNIIITFCRNYTLDDAEDKGRQGINNIATLDGYYITNGKAIKIKCEKETRGSQTIYKDLDGNEIKVNDGNTYIGICPIDADVKIEGPEEPEPDTEPDAEI